MQPELAEAPEPKVMLVHVPDGKDVLLGDLPVSVLRGIAKSHDQLFSQILMAPLLGDGGAAEDIYRACCDLAGVRAPETIKSQDLYDAFEAVPADPTKRATTTG